MLSKCLYLNSILKVRQSILSLKFLHLALCVFLHKFLDANVAATDTDLHVALLYLDEDASLSESVDSFAFTEKHDLHLVTFGVIVSEVSEGLIDVVFLSGHVLVLEDVVVPLEFPDASDHLHLEATLQVFNLFAKCSRIQIVLIILFGSHVLFELKLFVQIGLDSLVIFLKLVLFVSEIVLKLKFFSIGVILKFNYSVLN